MNAKLNGNIIEKQICPLVECSTFLEELDISGNKLLLGSLVKLLEILSRNRSLTHLNLASNNLHAHHGTESDDKSTPKEALISRSSTIV